jgi:polyhydroxyalkanoate synthesis regulator phasin
MNADNLTQILHQGFRVTLGATSSMIEMLQDSQKRNENLEKIQSQWSQLAQEWAEKGEQTEEEARKFVDTILEQQSNSGAAETTTSTSSSSMTTTPVSVSEPDSAEDLQELTAQIAALRLELERLRGSESSN